MPDAEITCAECGEPFPFTEREQSYYSERKLSPPKRCKGCRDARRASFSGGQPSSERPRFDIVCDKCGKTDQVPFKPTPGRAVLCSECFSAGRSQRGIQA
jgi:CxxC-x17-CxxC domain-containing protein